MFKNLFLVTVLLTFGEGCATQTPLVRATETAPVVEKRIHATSIPGNVSIYQLDNGMQVLMIANPALPMVGINVVVKVGSAYETFATSGMSHMLEHLLFNGTKSRTQKQLYDDVDRIGGYNNANTAEFYTNYMMVTPAEHIKKGMEIQSDMLFHSILPAEKFGKEKGIVLEEIARSLAKPNEQIERNINSILYRGHALSLPTLGTYSTIESMSRESVAAFYKNNYVPNNMILSAVGNFQPDSMLAWIKHFYGTPAPGEVQRRDIQGWSTGFQEPEQMPLFQTDFIYHRFYDGKKNKLQLFYPLPGEGTKELLTLLQETYSDHVDSLQSSVQSQFPDQINSVQISTRGSVLANYLQVTVNYANGVDLEKLTNVVDRQLRQIKISVSPTTVRSHAIKTRTNFLKNIEKPHMFGIFNAEEFAVGGIESVLASYTGDRYFEAATLLRNFRLDRQPVVIVQHPSRRAAPEQTSTSGKKELFKAENGSATGIAVQNKASDLLAIHYLIKHKAAFESKFGRDAAKILHDCLQQRLTSEENLKASSRFGLSYKFNDNPYIPMDNIYLHSDFGYIRVEGLADDLTGAIAFLNKKMSGFVPTQNEFQKSIQKFHRSAQHMGEQKAKNLFDKTYKSLIYEPVKYQKNATAPTYEALVAFAKQYFQPANMIISVVSPAAPDSIHKLFAGFKSDTATLLSSDGTAWDRGLQNPTKPINLEKQGGGAQSYLFWGFVQNIDAKDKPALQALSLILRDHIIFDIREKQGLAYRMSAGISLKQDKALFYIHMATRPQNVDKLLPQYPGFFTAASLDSLTAGELEKSLNMYLGRMMFRRLSSINRAYYLGHSYYFHNDINYDGDFLEHLKKVTVENVKQVAKKYMHVQNPVSVVVR